MIELRKATQEDLDAILAIPLDAKIGAYPNLSMDDLGVCVLINDTLIACGGVKILWPHVGEAWAILSKDVENLKTEEKQKLVLLMKKWINRSIEDNELCRVQAVVRSSFGNAIRLVKALGFQCEGLMKKYAPDGDDMYMYGRIT
jgi:hypothetical protein